MNYVVDMTYQQSDDEKILVDEKVHRFKLAMKRPQDSDQLLETAKMLRDNNIYGNGVLAYHAQDCIDVLNSMYPLGNDGLNLFNDGLFKSIKTGRHEWAWAYLGIYRDREVVDITTVGEKYPRHITVPTPMMVKLIKPSMIQTFLDFVGMAENLINSTEEINNDNEPDYIGNTALIISTAYNAYKQSTQPTYSLDSII